MYYDLGVAGKIGGGFELNFADWFIYGLQVDFNNFKIVPYRQYLLYTNPSSVAAGYFPTPDLALFAKYVLNLGALQTQQKFVMPEFSISLVDWLRGLVAGEKDWYDAFPNEGTAWLPSPNVFADPYTSFTTNTKLDPLQEWTGPQMIWSWCMLNTLTPM